MRVDLHRRLVQRVRRLVCAAVGHRMRAPAMEHGSKIPVEFTPKPDDPPERALALFHQYTAIRCARCGEPGPSVHFGR